jgi:hypothetical protein
VLNLIKEIVKETTDLQVFFFKGSRSSQSPQLDWYCDNFFLHLERTAAVALKSLVD